LGTSGNTLTLWFLFRLFFLCGFVVGVVAIPIYAAQQIVDGSLAWQNLLLVMIAAPVINGFCTAIVGAIGYPIYAALAKRGQFKLDVAD
jgi:hypothetical protein